MDATLLKVKYIVKNFGFDKADAALQCSEAGQNERDHTFEVLLFMQMSKNVHTILYNGAENFICLPGKSLL